jgi:hypothetical protein
MPVPWSVTPHVHARLEDAEQLRTVRHDRRVEDAVRTEREECVDVARRRDAELLAAQQLADVLPLLLGAVHPTARELELGVREHAFDRGAADATGCPLDHAIRHPGSLLLDGSIP